MQPQPKCRPPVQSHSPFLRAWRGEIGLYRAAYGLGGLGLALVSLLEDILISLSAFAGGFIGRLSYSLGGAGELAFAWVSVVATWRAARKGRDGGRAYGRIAIGLALIFVGIQFVLIAGWTRWSDLAELGVARDPDDTLLDMLTATVARNCIDIDQLCKALATVN